MLKLFKETLMKRLWCSDSGQHIIDNRKYDHHLKKLAIGSNGSCGKKTIEIIHNTTT